LGVEYFKVEPVLFEDIAALAKLASHEPRWGTANLSTSCECAASFTPAIIAKMQSAPMFVSPGWPD